MKKRNMNEYLIGILILLLVFIPLAIVQPNNLTGKAVGGPQDASSGGGAGMMAGPNSEQVTCMSSCMGCSSSGVECTGKQEQCMAQCNVEPEPEAADEGEACMQECIVKGCGEFDFDCQNKNRETCEEKCDMLGDKPDESEISAEQLCITNCVEAVAPGTRCGTSQTGETGGEVCQKCAADCVHLYEGPCLDDEKLSAKKKECGTCENCYGEPVMGDSGEGWECIVDVKCGDASSEFGDEPGTGEGIVANIGEAIGNVFEGIGDFFSNLFSGVEESSE